MENKYMWEILVPTVSNEGKPYRTRFHRVWDKKIRDISNGLTILTPAKGQWLSKSGELYVERMIPVRILCSREDIEKIIDITMVYYNQLAVLAYKISDEYILKHKSDGMEI
jgi:hypothetical protein